MKREQIKTGLIVVVKEGLAFGNKPDTITKIISNTGCTDQCFARFGKKMDFKHYVLCKAPKNSQLRQTFRNAPCYMEEPGDLRFATEEEKKLFRKNNYQPITLN